jgi:putative two-component system response regulator
MTTKTATEPTPSQALPSLAADFGGSAKHAKMKILVIDDEPANVALLEGLLTDSGYTRVTSITDSRKALETYNVFQPDLLLLDLMMPHVDGMTILETLRSQAGDMFLPVLVLTADVNEKTKLRALQAGATDFLLKPFDQIEALLRIGNLLEIRRLHIQLDNQRAAFEDSLRARTSELRGVELELKTNAWRKS